MHRFAQFAVVAAALVALAFYLSTTAAASDAVTVVIPASTDGAVYGTSPVYANARAYYSGCNDGAAIVGQLRAWQTYVVDRSGLLFKLDAIPAGATIVYARLTATITADNSGVNFTGEVERVDAPSPICSNGATWYGASGAAEGTLFDTAANPGTGDRSLVVDHTALAPGGTAGYLVRSSRDIAAQAPTGQETVTLGTGETGQPATLLVVYYP